MSTARLPNMLVIGAAKCGTTAVYEYLAQHPEIYMSPVKEPRFFALDGLPLTFGGPFAHIDKHSSVNSLDVYTSLFSGVQGEKVIGEASPLYLYDPRAPERIRHYIPDVKMVAILRDPIERAFSGYIMHRMQGREHISFEEAIRDEPRRIRENWLWGRYTDVSLYAEQLERFYRTFDRSQLRVYLYENFKANPAEIMEDMYRFLSVDDSFRPRTDIQHNVSGLPRNKVLDTLIGQRPNRYWLSKLRPYLPEAVFRARDRLRQRNLAKPQLTPDIRARLIPLFRDDIRRLEEMLETDLSHWLN